MTVDLFLTKEEVLEGRLRHVFGPFSSVDATEIGLKIGYTRAPRTVRQWAKEGRVRRLSHEECIMRGLWKEGNQRLAWYEVVNL